MNREYFHRKGFVIAIVLGAAAVTACSPSPLLDVFFGNWIKEQDPSSNTQHIDPAPAEKVKTLAGMWRLEFAGSFSGSWDAPNNLFISYAGSEPFGSGQSGNSEKTYVVFDPANFLIQTYNYDQQNNTVRLDSPQNDGILGRQFQLVDGVFTSGEVIFGSGGDPNIEQRVTGVVEITVNDETMSGKLVQRLFLKALADIPEDTNAGRPAIPSGYSATYTATQNLEFKGTPPPAALYPGSTWQLN